MHLVLLMLGTESTSVIANTHPLPQWSGIWSGQEIGHSGTVRAVHALSTPLAKDSESTEGSLAGLMHMLAWLCR